MPIYRISSRSSRTTIEQAWVIRFVARFCVRTSTICHQRVLWSAYYRYNTTVRVHTNSSTVGKPAVPHVRDFLHNYVGRRLAQWENPWIRASLALNDMLFDPHLVCKEAVLSLPSQYYGVSGKAHCRWSIRRFVEIDIAHNKCRAVLLARYRTAATD